MQTFLEWASLENCCIVGLVMETRTGIEFDPFLCCRFREARRIDCYSCKRKDQTCSFRTMWRALSSPSRCNSLTLCEASRFDGWIASGLVWIEFVALFSLSFVGLFQRVPYLCCSNRKKNQNLFLEACPKISAASCRGTHNAGNKSEPARDRESLLGTSA